MPYGDPYITLAELKAYLRLDSDPGTDDDDLTQAIESATSEITSHCGRDFNRDASGTGTGTAEPGALYADTSALPVPSVYENTGTSEFPSWDTYPDDVTSGTGTPVNGVTTGTTGDLYLDLDDYAVNPATGWYLATGTDTWTEFSGTVLTGSGAPTDSAAPTTRLFQPAYADRLIVDDFYTTTGLVFETGSGSTWDPEDLDDLVLKPLNGIRDGMSGWPYFRIEGSGVAGPATEPTVRITAHWGWSAIPAPIIRATKLLAAETFKLREAPFGVAGWSDFGVVRVRDIPKVAKILYPFEKRRVKVGA
jgi:hypothetical protein